jgi:D-alanine-D-alanine ligase
VLVSKGNFAEDECGSDLESNEENDQMNQEKLRIGVIFGGRSGEHEVSLRSASSVIAALDRNKYEVVLIGITKTGRWIIGNVTEALEDGLSEAATPAALLPDPQTSGLMEMELIDKRPALLSEVTKLDMLFPVLHGPYGEDGTVQGLLELADLPYVGAGVVGSAVGMDKAIFKAVMHANGLPIVPWQLVLTSSWLKDKEQIIADIENSLDFPLFTKPANLGSSVGINKCENRRELDSGIAEAARYDRRVIVEKGLDARELEVSVLGNDTPIASVVGEIRPKRSFYDYVAKYISDDSELIIPAQLEESLSDDIRELAVKAFIAIDCAGLGRVDFLLEKSSNKVYINELNTIPGFTEISMYSKLWDASGVSYSELLDRLIELAVERYKVKSALETSYSINENGQV